MVLSVLSFILIFTGRTSMTTTKLSSSSLLLLLFVFSCQSQTCCIITQAHPITETRLDAFFRPEDLLDIEDTPWILVSELSTSRTEPGKISLLHTGTKEKYDFAFPNFLSGSGTYSPFAQAACQPRKLSEIAPHGVSGRRISDDSNTGDWEVAVVNHYAYESIEFYRLSNLNSSNNAPPRIQSMGCLILSQGIDFHNSVSYSLNNDNDNNDQRLAVTKSCENFYIGLPVPTLSCFAPLVPGTGSLKIVSPGGGVTTVATNLSGPNGVLYMPNSGSVWVVENPTGLIIEYETERFETRTVIETKQPDNLQREKNGRDSFLFTQIDSTLPEVAVCNSVLDDCILDFSVWRHDDRTNTASRLYASQQMGQTTCALNKNGVLYIGNTMSQGLLIVEGLDNL
jgi:hypothetical protein